MGYTVPYQEFDTKEQYLFNTLTGKTREEFISDGCIPLLRGISGQRETIDGKPVYNGLNPEHGFFSSNQSQAQYSSPFSLPSSMGDFYMGYSTRVPGLPVTMSVSAALYYSYAHHSPWQGTPEFRNPAGIGLLALPFTLLREGTISLFGNAGYGGETARIDPQTLEKHIHEGVFPAGELFISNPHGGINEQELGKYTQVWLIRQPSHDINAVIGNLEEVVKS